MLHIRPRRLRTGASIADLVAETNLSVNDLIQPVFVIDGKNISTESLNMRGFITLSLDKLVDRIKLIRSIGIKAIALFPKIGSDVKDEFGSEALKKNNLICKAIRLIKSAVPDIILIGDVALDPYTSHGHDGVLDKDGDVDNDATVKLLIEQALVLADAGVDVVAPSDMMDGRILKIREALESMGFIKVKILSYSVKYASSLYAPFRLVMNSAECLGFGKKNNYQMDFRNAKEAIKETLIDINEGSDFVMVKPAGFYLDIISDICKNITVPLLAYQVSGEYAMIKNAAAHGFFNEHDALYESLIAIKRSGAVSIITYAAEEIGEMLCK